MGSDQSARNLGACPAGQKAEGILPVFSEEQESSARTSERLMGRRRDDVRVRDRIKLVREDLSSDKAGKVSHIDKKHRLHTVGNLSHPSKVDLPGIGGVACD